MSEAMHLKAEKKSANAKPGAAPKRRVALLGAGYVVDWHAKCLKSVAGVELVAVCDQAQERAEALAARFGIAKSYGSLAVMLQAEKLDAVHVLLPPDLHFAAASTVMEAGVSVYLEKPMCDRWSLCEELIRKAAARSAAHLGVGHNFLFSRPWEQLRRDVRSGILGRIDQMRITWNRFLPQSAFGPFDIYMLRDPRNIMLETGSHLVAYMLDLVGEPDEMEVRAGNAIKLPTGRSFYRRWQVRAVKGPAAIGIECSFAPGFAEHNIHVRGSLAAATADIERNTYALERYRPADPDFENYAIVANRVNYMKAQARWTLAKYVLSKLGLEKRGTAYGESMARALDAYYDAFCEGADGRAEGLDERVSGQFGARVIRVCEQIGERANLPAEPVAPRTEPKLAGAGAKADILVLGGAGFIGKELVRQLVAAGRGVRVLVRNAAGFPEELRAQVDYRTGNLLDREALLGAMEGVDCVVHLARAHVKTWAEYQKYEIDATRLVAECALQAGVKRLIYTGTIDSYYAGRRGSTITEATPLDPHIARRNLYARAKALSEAALLEMHRERKLPLVIVRPGIVIGRGGSPFHWGVGMWWHDAVCQVWGRGNNKLPLVLVEDVARGLIAAMDTPAIEGRDFNLVADQFLSTQGLSAQEYLDELDHIGGMRIQRYATPILRFYLLDMLKWVVKVAVRHPERQMPSYRDWKSRTQQARFDCAAAKMVLGWNPVSERGELVRKGIEEPLREFLQ
jgi:nucleoside-diphosphate-sugar epimerase/predicted dehydrogenase